MNKLEQFLASGTQRTGSTLQELMEQEVPRITSYQAFAVEEAAAKERADQSPLVLWAKKTFGKDADHQASRLLSQH